MSRTLLEQSSIDPESPEFAPILANLQGNILREHGRLYSGHLILRFKPSYNASAAEWIRGLELTSTADQLAERKSKTASASPFRAFSMAKRCYEYFGYDHRIWPEDSVFRASMKQIDLGKVGLAMTLSDPPVGEWEEAYQEEIHAVLLLAHDDPKVLNKELDAVRRKVEPFATLLTIEKGHHLVNSQGVPIEAFGFVDGISQPTFLED